MTLEIEARIDASLDSLEKRGELDVVPRGTTPEDDIDRAIDSIDRREEDRVRSNLELSQGVDAEQHGKAVRLARGLGLDPSILRDDTEPAELKAKSFMAREAAQEVLGIKALTRFYSNYDQAAMARDDTHRFVNFYHAVHGRGLRLADAPEPADFGEYMGAAWQRGARIANDLPSAAMPAIMAAIGGPAMDPEQERKWQQAMAAGPPQPHTTGWGAWLLAPAWEQTPLMFNILGATAVGAGEGALVGGGLGAGIGALAGGIGAGPGFVGGAGTGAAIGGKTAGVLRIFDIEASAAFAEFQGLTDEDGKPIDQQTLAWAAIAVGIANSGMEFAGFLAVAKVIPGVRRLLDVAGIGSKAIRESIRKQVQSPTTRAAIINGAKEGLKAIGIEVATEAGQETSNIVATKVLTGEDVGMKDVERLRDIVQQTGMAVPFLVLPGITIGTTISRISDSHNNKVRIENARKALEGAKLREVSPEDFRNLTAEVAAEAGIESVQINAGKLKEYYQQAGLGPEEMEADIPGVQEQLAELEQFPNPDGYDVEIPAGVYFDTVNERFGDAIVDDLRLRPEDDTLREAQTAEKALPQRVTDLLEQERKLQEESAAADAADSSERVYVEVLRTLEENSPYGKEAREAQALLWRHRYRTRAQRLQEQGKEADAWELFQSENFSLERESQQPSAVRQPQPALEALLAEKAVATGRRRIENVLDDLRAGRQPELTGMPKLPVVNLLKRLGGVDPASPLASELEAIGLERRGPGAVPGLYRRGGLTAVDDLDISSEPVLAALVEYEAGKVDPNLIYRLIDEELRGKPVRTEAELERIEPRQRERAELQAALEELGIDLEQVDNAAAIEALEQGVSSEQQAGEFFQKQPYQYTPGQLRLIQEEVETHPESERVLSSMQRLAGTPWERGAREAALARVAIKRLLAGQAPRFGSVFGAPSVRRPLATGLSLRDYLLKGEDGAWEFFEDYGFLGHASKPVNTVTGSYLDCEPSALCAVECYAGRGTYAFPYNVARSELISWAIERDPVRAAGMVAEQYKTQAEFLLSKALRLNDKGEMTEAWVPFIEELNRQGVRVQVFSKRPDILRQVDERNLRLLSIDQSNVAMAAANPDLRVAVIYMGLQDVEMLQELGQQIGVILPVKRGDETLSQEELDGIPKNLRERACPVDYGKTSIAAGYNCTVCDSSGNPLGCFPEGMATAEVMEVWARDLRTDPDFGQTVEEIRDGITRVLGEHAGSVLAELDLVAAEVLAGTEHYSADAVAPRSARIAGAPGEAARLEFYQRTGKRNVRIVMPDGSLLEYSTAAKVYTHAVVRKISGGDSPGWRLISRTNQPETALSKEFKARPQGFEDSTGQTWGEAQISPIEDSGLQQAKGVTRGAIDVSDMQDITMRLFNAANLSTFLHESGHLFLAQLELDAATGGGQLLEDLSTIRNWLDMDEGQAFEREQHERWASAFEEYLRQGKAPSNDLRMIFQRFKLWLDNLYKRMKGQAELAPEISDVMDRLIASDEEIALARERAALEGPRLTEPETGIPARTLARIRDAHDRAADAGRARLDQKLLRDLEKKKKAEWERDRADMREEVEAEVNAMPMYRAQHWLRTGEWLADPIDVPHQKLDRAKLQATWGEEITRVLGGGRNAVWQRDGMDPDEAAEILGFTSADLLVRAMASAGNRKNVIEKLTDERMVKVYGDIFRDGSIEEEAYLAAANEESIRAMAIEERAYAARTEGKASATQVARQAAREAVQGMKVRDIKPYRWRMAAQRAGRAAIEAAAAKDFEEAQAQKALQIINSQKEIEGRKQLERVERIRKFLKRFTEGPTRERLGLGGKDYLDQVDKILERFEFKAGVSLEEARQRTSLMHWIGERMADDQEVDIPELILKETLSTHWKNLTVMELGALRDAIQNIDHLAREGREARSESEKAQVSVVAHQAAEQIRDQYPDREYEVDDHPTRIQKARDWAAAGFSTLRRVEFLIDAIQGDDPLSPLRRWVWDPLVAAQNKYNEMSEAYREALLGMVEHHLGDRTKTYHEILPESRLLDQNGKPLQLDKWQLIAAQLNVGNASNLRKLLTGWKNWNTQLLDEVVWTHLDKQDMDFIQDVWDLVNALWPKASAVHQRSSGLAPPKIEALEVKTPFGTYRGGYYPVVFDPMRSDMGKRNEIATLVPGQSEGYTSATTGHGHMESRTDAAAPLLLSADVITRHIDQVIMDISYREAIRNAGKVLRQPELDNALKGALGEKYSYRNFWVPWLQHQARDSIDPGPMQWWNALARQVRINATVFKLAFKESVLILQAAGHFNSHRTLKQMLPQGATKYWAWGCWEAFGRGRYSLMMRTNAEVRLKSLVMKHRIGNATRDMRDIIRDAERGLETSLPRHVREVGMRMIGWIQYWSVDLPTWLAAYRGSSETMGLNEEQAVRFADSVVRKSQGAGNKMDQAAFQRGGKGGSEAIKASQLFYSYSVVVLNQLWNSGRMRKVVDGKQRRIRNIPAFFTSYLFFAIMPGLYSYSLYATKFGRWPDEDDENYNAQLLDAALDIGIGDGLQGVPFVRDAWPYFIGQRGRSSSALYIFERGIADASNFDLDEPMEMMFDFMRLGTMTFGMPMDATIGWAEKFLLEEDK